MNYIGTAWILDTYRPTLETLYTCKTSRSTLVALRLNIAASMSNKGIPIDGAIWVHIKEATKILDKEVRLMEILG